MSATASGAASGTGGTSDPRRPLPLLRREAPSRPHHLGRTRRPSRVRVALAWIATDANTKTPGRIAEPGPWWKATQADSPTPTIHVRPQCPDHPSQDAGTCAPCARLAAATDHTAGIAACRQAIRTKGTKP